VWVNSIFVSAAGVGEPPPAVDVPGVDVVDGEDDADGESVADGEALSDAAPLGVEVTAGVEVTLGVEVAPALEAVAGIGSVVIGAATVACGTSLVAPIPPTRPASDEGTRSPSASLGWSSTSHTRQYRQRIAASLMSSAQ
jgi:hypothetical protein